MEHINWDFVRPCLWSGASGLVLGAIVLVQGFGYMSPSSANKLAVEKSETAVVAALAPSCASDFRELPDAKSRMATLVANKDSYQARDAFPAELVTLPGKTYIDYNLSGPVSGCCWRPAYRR